MRRRRQVGIGCGFAMVAVLVGLLIGWPIAVRKAHKLSCRNRLCSIGIACMMYAGDHGGKFPSNWSQCARYYANCVEILDCPADGSDLLTLSNVDRQADYMLVPGRSESDSPDTVIVFERLGNHSEDGGHVVLRNGSVVWYSPAEYKKLGITNQMPQSAPRELAQ